MFKLHKGGNARRGKTPPLKQEPAETQTPIREGPNNSKSSEDG